MVTSASPETRARTSAIRGPSSRSSAPASGARPAGSTRRPCGSPDTVEQSEFSATACKALRRCRACGEPFEHVKEI